MKKLFILIFFITANLSLAEELVINYSQDAFQAEFLNINYSYELENSKLSIIPNSEFSSIIYEEGFPENVLSFYFAVPANNEYEVEITTKEFTDLNQEGLYYNEYEKETFYKIQDVGLVRGINIKRLIINPFRISEKGIKVLSSISFTVNYDKPKNSKAIMHSNKDLPAYNLINLADAVSLKVNIKNEKKLDKIQSSSWYNSEKTYYRFHTSRDGIAALRINDIRDKFPNFPNISDSNLNQVAIYHKGEKVPFYPHKDSQDNNYDVLYIEGRRAAGDTTFNDHYAAETTFFLTFEDIGSEIMQSISPLTNMSKIDEVDFNYHVEEDRIYRNGIEFMTSFNAAGEGWYWHELSLIDDQFYDITKSTVLPMNIEPVDNSDIKFNLQYTALVDSVKFINQQTGLEGETTTRYELGFSLNGVEYDRINFNGHRKSNYKYNFSSEDIIPGRNDLGFESYEVYSHTNGRLALDYYTIEGKMRPIAIDGIADFYIYDSIKNSFVEIRGFSELSNAIITNLSGEINYYQTGAASKGYDIQAGIDDTDTSFVSLKFDNQNYTSYEKGIHTIVLSGSSFEQRYFESSDDSAPYFENIDNNSVLLIAINKEIEINSSLRNHLINSGYSSEDFDENSSRLFFFSRNNEFSNLLATESDGIAKLSQFIESEKGYSYLNRIELPDGDSLRILAINRNLIEYVELESVNSTSYSVNKNNQADAIFITHPLFIEGAERLAKFREKSQGINLEVVNVFDIYKEFNYGVQSVHAIKDFLKFAYENWQDPKIKYLTIIGDASWDISKRLERSFSDNFIPTYGFPPSDFWFGIINDDKVNISPEIYVGRIPVNTQEEMDIVVDKLIRYDTMEVKPWMKDFLLMTGGYNELEMRSFYFEILDNLPPQIVNNVLGGDTTFIKKKEPNVTSESQSGEIRAAINNGAIWTNFLGHASAETFDLDGWNVATLNNKDRYGLLTTLSCNTGAYAEPAVKHSRNEGYFLEENKGFISAMGSSTIGFVKEHRFLTQKMMESLNQKDIIYRRIGDILYYGKSHLYSRLDNSDYAFHIYTQFQFSMMGDPLTRIRIAPSPELFILDEDLELKSSSGNEVLMENDDEIIISSILHNNGFCIDDNFDIEIRRIYNNNLESKRISFDGLCKEEAFKESFRIKGMAGVHDFEIILDPDNLVDDYSRVNNTHRFSIEVFTEGLLALEPFRHMVINASQPIFRVINPFANEGEFEYYFEIVNDENNTLYSSKESELIENDLFIEWKPFTNLQNDAYKFNAYYINQESGNSSTVLEIPFSVNNTIENNYKLFDDSHFQENQINNVIYEEFAEEIRFRLEETLVPFRLMSFLGNDSVLNRVTIEVGEQVFIDQPFELGMNIVIYPGIEGAFEPFRKRYNTWGPYEWEEDSSSVRFNQFLRDSIPDNAYVFLANCQSSFRLFGLHQKYKQDLGSMDSLRYYLNQYGSEKIYEIDGGLERFDWLHTFAFCGWKGATGEQVFEDFNPNGDSTLITDFIKVYKPKGYIKSEMIGPALDWHNVSVDRFINEDIETSNIIIKGYSVDGDIDTLINDNRFIEFSLESIDAETYPYIEVTVNFEITTEKLNDLITKEKSYIAEINVEYTPLPEIAISQKDIVLSEESILRGTPLELSANIHNISMRSDFDGKYKISINDIDYEYNLSIPKNQTYTVEELLFETDDLFEDNNLSFNVNSSNIPEFYAFNNNAKKSFGVDADTIRPQIKLKYQGREIQEGDYLPIMPRLEIELYDNSPLAITDSSSITARINGYFHPGVRTKEIEFISYGKTEDGLKAKLYLTPDSLQFEDALIFIYAKDTEGNRDTLSVLVNVSLRNANLSNALTYPNPSERAITFRFDYKAPLSEGDAKIEIYDYVGNSIHSFSTDLKVGMNEIYWNGYDRYGNALSSGNYFYILRTRNTVYSDPIRGKFVIVR